MACTSQSMLYANSCCVFPSQRFFSNVVRSKGSSRLFIVNASAGTEESDCNTEECAPDKEVGKVSMEWLAGDKTKVVGTFPPKKKGWTGYVEKDTAGQTNIYSVEPTVYVAESAISSGTAGTSSEGSESTVALAAGLALVSVAVASFTLLQVSKNQPQVREPAYSGPPLSYYINKFKPVSIIEASAPAELQTAPTVEASTPLEPSSSTAEASVPPITIQSDNNVQAAPEIAVQLKEQVEAQSSAAGNVS